MCDWEGAAPLRRPPWGQTDMGWCSPASCSNAFGLTSKKRNCSSGTCFTFPCPFHTKSVSLTPLQRPSPTPNPQAVGTGGVVKGQGRGGDVAGGRSPHLRCSGRIPGPASEGALAAPAALAAGREWLSAQLPFTFRFHNAPMRLFNQNPKKARLPQPDLKRERAEGTRLAAASRLPGGAHLSCEPPAGTRLLLAPLLVSTCLLSSQICEHQAPQRCT